MCHQIPSRLLFQDCVFIPFHACIVKSHLSAVVEENSDMNNNGPLPSNRRDAQTDGRDLMKYTAEMSSSAMI
jgi:hypothetical protein